MRLIPLPRGMSPGFYAFMAPGCIRRDDGTLLMLGPEDNPADEQQPTKEEWEQWEREQAEPEAARSAVRQRDV